jgi:hypothetical protein
LEGIRHGSAFYARVALAALVATLVAALIGGCASAPPAAEKTPFPTLAPLITGSNPAFTPGPPSSSPTTAPVPDPPMTTKAVALSRPNRGSGAPAGAIVFGNDVIESGQRVTVDSQRTQFAAGHEIAWRVTLPAATGGESVRITLTTEANTETLVDEFVAQAGWNVYYGRQLLTVAPGTYVLHYLVDGHEKGSGTFKIKPGDDTGGATPTPFSLSTDEPGDLPSPTAKPATPSPQ